jgi:lipopolysaccharide transport system ATP-binding protein
MSQPVIQVENFGKRYYLAHAKRSSTLRDAITATARNFGQRLLGSGAVDAGADEFWALKDVSFEIKQGEVVGIIGRNGAGKSTLLKLLSRITEPTTGRARVRGRIASLLEVGTGFHPELTGRDNIFLNGAILGMSRAEIQRKFDEIVAFAEVERFLDTQVKHYSSGMYVRLAFAVAAHLEPEILILDEVLAVGDADFQRKCLGKMNSVAHQGGRTVLFVSHNLASVQQLCDRAIVLRQGQIACDGDAATGIAAYLAMSNRSTAAATSRMLGDELELTVFRLQAAAVETFGAASIEMVLRARQACSIFELCVIVVNAAGQRVALADVRTGDGVYALRAGQELSLRVELGRLALIPGTYDLGFFIRSDRHMRDYPGLQTIDILPRATKQAWASYGSEYLGHVALEATVAATITSSPDAR